MHHTLKCASCRETEQVKVNRVPVNSLGAVAIAKREGWLTVHDEERNEIFFYCTSECEFLGRRQRVS